MPPRTRQDLHCDEYLRTLHRAGGPDWLLNHYSPAHGEGHDYRGLRITGHASMYNRRHYPICGSPDRILSVSVEGKRHSTITSGRSAATATSDSRTHCGL